METSHLRWRHFFLPTRDFQFEILDRLFILFYVLLQVPNGVFARLMVCDRLAGWASDVEMHSLRWSA
jgi:hypothetical protein